MRPENVRRPQTEGAARPETEVQQTSAPGQAARRQRVAATLSRHCHTILPNRGRLAMLEPGRTTVMPPGASPAITERRSLSGHDPRDSGASTSKHVVTCAR